jgi:5,6-dimethylbenzimidazole synthase
VETQVESPPDTLRYGELLGLIRRRRSIRNIDSSVPVSDEVVTKVLEAARLAPSASNSQPWEFIVIRDKEMRERITKLYVKQQSEKREMQRAVFGRSVKSSNVGNTGFRHAPVYIVQICDTRLKAAFPIRTQLDKGDRHLNSSMALASCQLHLAIASLGLGSQWVSDVGSPYMATMMRTYLGIPDYFDIYDMTGIGYPAGGFPNARPRRPLEQMIHFETYDNQKSRTSEDIEQFLMDYTRRGREAG